METLITKLGYLTAILGFLLCALAGAIRVTGMFYLLDFEAITILQAGIALMVFACMVRLYFPASTS
ncbi:MAG: hypothetical protein OQK09_05510 [Colwellia sp.]|nr:hypothetical protein [Colwellia sp.]MCW8863336.1 hypothetical protein [Colwellia sp.]MCW9080950.1 hypothetical protein [Colwellia sp.]